MSCGASMSDIDHHVRAPSARRGRGRPRTQSDGQRRADIIDSARRTFIDLGFAGTTTDIVAARCKISKQTLYRLFPSKTELFLAVVTAHRQMMLALPRPDEEDEPVADVLQKIFMINMDEETRREREAFIHIVVREGGQFPEIAEILAREGIDRSRKDLADWLQVQNERGKLVLDAPASGARMLMDMLFGAAGMPDPNWKTPDDRRDHLRLCIAIFTAGAGTACFARPKNP